VLPRFEPFLSRKPNQNGSMPRVSRATKQFSVIIFLYQHFFTKHIFFLFKENFKVELVIFRMLLKLIIFAVATQVHVQSEWDGQAEFIPPSILLPVFVRNKEHALPYFFGGLERQNYPKSRIRLWFVTDHNADNSLEVIKAWKEAWEVVFRF